MQTSDRSVMFRGVSVDATHSIFPQNSAPKFKNITPCDNMNMIQRLKPDISSNRVSVL